MGQNHELKAPKGKFRVIGVDTFEHDDFLRGDFDTLEEAKRHGTGGTMLKVYIYDDQGRMLSNSGTF